MNLTTNLTTGALLLVTLALTALALTATATKSTAQDLRALNWAAVPGPTSQSSELGAITGAIGFYSHGCLAGGVALPQEGPGHQVIRPQRRRFYGHPELVSYVNRFSDRIAALNIGSALIGDLAMPRGGPMPLNHVSHQTGLDVDIFFDLPPTRLDLQARQTVEPRDMVRDFILTEDWTDAQTALIRTAADDPRVERIFVSPPIKQALCAMEWADRSWLSRVRPWYGHRGHMHIRLSCPTDSPECIPQEAQPRDDGCGGNLAWWMTNPRPSGGGGGSGRNPMPGICALVHGAP